MINSRSLGYLAEAARQVCQSHISVCAAGGIELLVTSTWRDSEAQDALYAIGRTVQPERRTVTNARGGHSWHNFQCAWDVVPIVGGKCIWDSSDPLWMEVIRIGKSVGAESGAEWKSFPDLPHFQFIPKPLTLAQAQERFRDTGSIFV